jgi:hypothetical protein
MRRGGRHPTDLAIRHLQDEDGLHGEDPRSSGDRGAR